jgi:phosphoribosylglycinamide formyltransferase-1
MKKIAIFASGSGSNAENIANYFEKHDEIIVDCILSNKSDAYVLTRAKKFGIDTFVFNRTDFYQSEVVLTYLKDRNVDFIVLAGFLWLVPPYLTDNYKNKIVNIHPALLPKYGGKGMFGMNVHNAVVEAEESESGITIHFVNDNYDEGDIIYQAKCPVFKNDTAAMVAAKVHELEYKYFPKIIEAVVSAIEV